AERLLLVMAKASDGRYFRSESINLNDLVAALDQLQKRAIGGGEYVEYEERYQGFLLAGFLLSYAGFLMSDRRGAWYPRLTLSGPLARMTRPGWPKWLRRGARSASLGSWPALGLGLGR